MPRSLVKYAVHPPYSIKNPNEHTSISSRCRNYAAILIGFIILCFFFDVLFHYNDPESRMTYDISQYMPIQLSDASLSLNPVQEPRVLFAAMTHFDSFTDSFEESVRPKRRYDLNSSNASYEGIAASINDENHGVKMDDFPLSFEHSIRPLRNYDIEQIRDRNDHDPSSEGTEVTEPIKQNEDIQNNESSNDQIVKTIKDSEDKNHQNDGISNDHDEIWDYWDFPKHSHSKPSDTSSARHRGEYEMHKARTEWFQREYIDKQKPLPPSSNLIEDFNTRCPVYDDNPHCQWTPPPESLCNWTNTAIFWHSMHGTMIGRDFRLATPPNHWIWDFAVELNQSGDCSCPSNVAFVFADNQEKEMRLSQRSYTLCNDNCHWFRVAQDYHPWDWFGKLGPLLELIDDAKFQEQFEYVVLTDADDQTLVQSPIDIVERFEFYNASIVVGGEATSYPNWQGQEKGFENAVYPWSRHHQHLNAGGFMGKIVNMIPYLEYMKRDYHNFTIERAEEIKEKGRNFWRDQTVWRNMHLKFYPDIKIDSLAKLWTRTDVFMYDL